MLTFYAFSICTDHEGAAEPVREGVPAEDVEGAVGDADESKFIFHSVIGVNFRLSSVQISLSNRIQISPIIVMLSGYEYSTDSLFS